MSEHADPTADEIGPMTAVGFTDGRIDVEASEHTIDFTYGGTPVHAYVEGWAAYMPNAPFWRVSFRGADFDAGEANHADTPEAIRDRIAELLRATPADR